MVEKLKKLTNSDSLVSLFLGVAVVIVIGVLIVNYFRGKQAPLTQEQTTAQEQQSATESATLPTTHTVTANETLWSIAEKTIGSGYNWVDIAQANKLSDPDVITAGTKLTIPKVAKREPGDASSASVETRRPADGKYTVQKGDYLWSISLYVYGTGYRWGEIATLNKLSNPEIIFTGDVLLLP